MNGMFAYAHKFKGCALSQWNVGKVTTMSNMFDFAQSFNRDISNWDTKSVTEFKRFLNEANEFNADVSGWNLSSLTKECNANFAFGHAYCMQYTIPPKLLDCYDWK